METQGSSDVRATERIFKKVVYPGLETLRVVDRNGIPISYPGFNSIRSKSFILSPRGVPMRTPSHIYSGHHAHSSKVPDMAEVPTPQENYYAQDKTFVTQPPLGSYSAKLPRKRNESPLQQKTRAATSQSAAPKQISKSSSSGHYLTGEAQEHRILQSANSNGWNISNQGLRLQREWTSLSNTRSMRRASEIVNHRVDRMYFMSGNSIKLKPRYDVDDDELQKMKELQAKNKETAHKRVHTRASSRNSNKSVPKKIEPIDLKKTMEPSESGDTGDQTASSEAKLKKQKGSMSPIHGWDAKENKNDAVEHELIKQKSLHEDENENVDNEKDNEKSEEVVQNGEPDKEEHDELEGMRADGRIDNSALSSDDQIKISEQEVTKTEQGEISKDDVEQGETKDENVAQENT